MESNEYNKTTEENAMGSSLEILKSSGDEIFGKIYRIQIPKSGNALSSSLGSLKASGAQMGKRISRTSHEIISSIKALTASGKKVFGKLPRLSNSSNAIGSSLEAINTSSSKIIKKIYQPPSSKTKSRIDF